MPDTGATHLLDDDTIFEDSYRIVHELGRGGFGVIYLAHQIAMERPVALKVLRPGVCDLDPTARKRFLREVKIISKLRHPNTVTIHDFGETDEGVVYMVLEYVDGEDLRSVLNHHGPQSPMRALGFARQIARSLAEAHDQGIIHRDLKPDNIMLTDLEGDADFVKVLDFGVARLRDSDVDLTSVGVPDGQRALMGTPRYMSPEQVRGEELTPAADLYSLGLLLYEMLFATPAVEGDTILELIRQQNSSDPLALDGIETLPGPIAGLLRRATAKSLEDRFSSGEEFSTAIDDAAARMSAEFGAQQNSESQEFAATSGRFSSVTPTPVPDSSEPTSGAGEESRIEIDDSLVEPADEDTSEDWYDSDFSADDFDDGSSDELFPDFDDEVTPTPPPVSGNLDDPTPTPPPVSGTLGAEPAPPPVSGTLRTEAVPPPTTGQHASVNSASSPQNTDFTPAMPGDESADFDFEATDTPEPDDDDITFGYGLTIAGTCALGLVTVLSIYAVFLVVGALIAEHLGGAAEFAVATIVAIAIPGLIALKEVERYAEEESGPRRLVRAFTLITIVTVGIIISATIAFPDTILDELRGDPAPGVVEATLADTLEQAAVAVDRYDAPEPAEEDAAESPDSPFAAPPERAPPSSDDAPFRATPPPPPPTRPATRGETEDGGDDNDDTDDSDDNESQ